MPFDPVTLFLGLLVGLVVGVTGVGGGSLMTPLLVLAFGVPPTTAVATDLLYAAITKSGGAWVHARRGGVAWRLVGLLAAGSVPAALATLAILHVLALDQARLGAVMTTALGFALIVTAAALLAKDRLHRIALSRARPAGRSPALIVATGAVLGSLVTLSSVGAGALGMAALAFLSPGIATARIVGTDIAHAVPLTLVAGLGHAATGVVDWSLLANLLAGSLPGIYIGSSLSQALPERLLRTLLAVMLVVIGGKLAW